MKMSAIPPARLRNGAVIAASRLGGKNVRMGGTVDVELCLVSAISAIGADAMEWH
jgi:hypothetical protein